MTHTQLLAVMQALGSYLCHESRSWDDGQMVTLYSTEDLTLKAQHLQTLGEFCNANHCCYTAGMYFELAREIREHATA